MQGSPSGNLSKTWCARAPAHASTHRSSGGGWMALTWPWRTHGCIAFQAATIATVGAYEVGQKKSASPQTPGTSADHKRLLMVDASATNRCTCEEDCLDGCDICEKELHKKKMQRIEARHHICLCSNDNKHGESWSDEPCGGNILICIGDKSSLCTGNLNTASLHTLGTTQLGALGMCAKTCKRRMPGCIASMPNHGTGSRGSHACSLPHPGL